MSKYTYIASTKDGQMSEGEIEAINEGMVLTYLQKHSLFPLSIKEVKQKSLGLGITFFERVSILDKIMFTKNLALMVKAGIGVSTAIDIMLEDAQKPLLKKIFLQVKFNLEKGRQLSDTLAAFPKHFSPVFISLLRAGEASGNLENALMQISAQLKKEHDLRKKIKSAMAYPIILLTAALGVIVLLVTLVLPRVGKIFEQSNVELPFLTKMLLGMSSFVTHQWLTTLITLIIAGVLIHIFRKSEIGKSFFHGTLSRIPVVAPLIQKIALTRFNSVLFSLLKAGVPIIRALEITANSIGNTFYKKIILDMTKNEVAKGISFGMALRRRPEYFPRLTTSMIIVGERSGNLEAMLENLAGFYEEEVDATLKSLITILEPALLLGVGVVIGSLALSIIMPIYQIIGTVR